MHLEGLKLLDIYWLSRADLLRPAHLGVFREQIRTYGITFVTRTRNDNFRLEALQAISARFRLGEPYMAKRKSKRRPWTSAEIRELKSAARNKTPARKIARNLKRSEGATRQKSFTLGLSLDSRG
jgi:hypothetical protein